MPRTTAPAGHRIGRRLGHGGVAGHAQVVVAGEVHHLGPSMIEVSRVTPSLTRK